MQHSHTDIVPQQRVRGSRGKSAAHTGSMPVGMKLQRRRSKLTTAHTPALVVATATRSNHSEPLIRSTIYSHHGWSPPPFSWIQHGSSSGRVTGRYVNQASAARKGCMMIIRFFVVY